MNELLNWLKKRDETRYALLVFTQFRIRGSEVSGYLVLVLEMASFDRLVQEVDNWAAESHHS
jgi:hypothetical protein